MGRDSKVEKTGSVFWLEQAGRMQRYRIVICKGDDTAIRPMGLSSPCAGLPISTTIIKVTERTIECVGEWIADQRLCSVTC